MVAQHLFLFYFLTAQQVIISKNAFEFIEKNNQSSTQKSAHSNIL